MNRNAVRALDHEPKRRVRAAKARPPDHEQVVVSARGLIGYISELVEAKRSEPGDDPLSAWTSTI